MNDESALSELRHGGVTCDGCGLHDFTGRRFKCTVCHDFDLCEACQPDDLPQELVEQFMHFGDGSLFGEHSFSWIDEPRGEANSNNNSNNESNAAGNNNNNDNNNNNSNRPVVFTTIDDGGEDDVDDDGEDDDDEEDDFDHLDEIDFDDVAQGNDSRMPSDVAAMLRSILQQRAEIHAASNNASGAANSALNNQTNSNNTTTNSSSNNNNNNNTNSGSIAAAVAAVAPSRLERLTFPPADSRPAPSSSAPESGTTILRKFIVPPSLSSVSTPHAGRFVCPVCGPQGVSGPVQGVIGDHIGADEVRSLSDMGLIYTEATLVAHFLHDHQEARTSMVCPICASRPDGIADYATSNIARHMMLRHRPSMGAFGALRDSRAPTGIRPRLASLMGLDPTRMMEEQLHLGSSSNGGGAENGFGAASLSGLKRVAKPTATSPDAVTADSLNVDLSSELDSGLAGPVLSKSTVQRDVKRAKFVQELVLSTLI